MSARRHVQGEGEEDDRSPEPRHTPALLRISIDHAQDMLYWIREDGRIFDVNQATCDALGYQRAELLSMEIFDIDPRLTPASYREAWGELRRRGGTRFETEHMTKAGVPIPVEVRRHIVMHEGQELNCAFAREINERKRVERRSAQLNRLLEAHRSVHQLIIREKEAPRLVERVCELLVESRGYQSAWIMLTEGALGPGVIVERGRCDDFATLARCVASEKGPLFLDVHGATVSLEGPPAGCRACPLVPGKRPAGLFCARLQHDQRSFGVFCVGVANLEERAEQERELFQEVAEDISFALHRLVLERERDHAITRHIALGRKILAAQERERARVARELHDELGQILTAVHFELDLFTNSPDARGLPSGLRDADGMVRKAITELRRVCRGLRPAVLDDLGLVPALKGLIGDLEHRLGLKVDWSAQLSDDGRGLSPERAVCLFRVAQEAFNNIVRHAEAKHIRVTLRETSDELTLEVQDDGRGFIVPREDLAVEGAFGLQGMRERADLAEGVLEIDSQPGGGTRVRLTVYEKRDEP